MKCYSYAKNRHMWRSRLACLLLSHEWEDAVSKSQDRKIKKCVSIYRQYWKKVVICCKVNHCQLCELSLGFILEFYPWLYVRFDFITWVVFLQYGITLKETEHRGRIRNQQQQQQHVLVYIDITMEYVTVYGLRNFREFLKIHPWTFS